jgi:serine/threonine-protein kinase
LPKIENERKFKMIGDKILHYKIIGKLGEGGMGEVYKAQDTKLDRFVALKFLPSQMTASEDDKARFIQEAKAASAMNHPNVCTIYDIQDNNGQLFIVMEYVDGKTLKDKKDKLSEKQILEIGIQVAEGLAAAHEKGIVHRDIKPENIMIRKDGIVQIMDFGLAKLRETSGVSRLTKAGTTMGTMGYMSPEQVQGLDVDHRTDIFSLGVVLYEMLAGESPFKGVHETAIMYEIVNVDPTPISSLKENVDHELDKLISDCLEKDKEERLQSAKELARNLRRFKRGSTGSRASKVFQTRTFTSKETETLKKEPTGFYSRTVKYLSKNKISSGIILLFAAVIILGLLKILSAPVSSFSQPVQFSFDIPGQSNQLLHWQKIFQISPDGRTIAYTDFSGSKSIIYARDINDVMPTPISGTEGGSSPVFINNNWLSFINGNMLRKVQLTGGVPDISNIHAEQGFSWGTAGELVYDKSWSDGLTYQNAWNGKEEELTKLDPSKGEGAHLWPYVLPGNKAALFTIWSNKGTFDDSKIGIVNLKTKERKNLSFNGADLQGTSPSLVQAPWGDYLLWSRGGDLFAAPFDVAGLKVTGTSVKILDGLLVNAESGVADYSVTNANNGTIIYVPGKLEIDKDYLVWVDKKGSEQKALTESGSYLMPMVSKEGRALIIIKGPVYSIGEIDFKKNVVTPLFTSGDNDLPKITPDGSSFVFVSNFEDGKYNIYLSRLDGIGGARKIVATEGGYPEISNLSPDGKYILFDQPSDTSKIMIKDIANNERPKILIKTNAGNTSPEFSPDGKFIAYRSNEIGGKFKLFVRPFPINNEKIQVSINDGVFAQWSFDGSKLYYRDGDKIMAARIQTKPELKVVSREVFCTALGLSGGGSGNTMQQDFAVAPDGRVLLFKDAQDMSKPVKLNVIVNWFSELKNKLANQN